MRALIPIALLTGCSMDDPVTYWDVVIYMVVFQVVGIVINLLKHPRSE